MDSSGSDAEFGDEGGADGASYTAQQATALLDAAWYTRTGQFGRWMDVVGDFAGAELILLEGDSSSAPSSTTPCSPAIAMAVFVHARYSLERVLQAYSTRNAVFEVIFFHDHRHLAHRTGASSAFVTESRRLARTFLMRSLQELHIPVQYFQNLQDARWTQFVVQRKARLAETQPKAEIALTMRVFVFDLLSSGIAVALMYGTQFKDAKIISLIYEQRGVRDARMRLDEKIWAAWAGAGAALDAEEASLSLPMAPNTVVAASSSRADWLCTSARDFLGDASRLDDDLACPLLYVFIVHAVMLDFIPLKLRAQPLPDLPPALKQYLHDNFLPPLFRSLERWMPPSPTYRDVDLDGRLFLRLLQIFICNSSDANDEEATVALLGPEVAKEVQHLWGALGTEARLATLSNHFHGFTPLPPPPHDATQPLSVLPFSHPVFEEHLAPVKVTAADASPVSPLATRKYFDFGEGGLGTLFEDTMHWHNRRRAILPKHLGGGDERPPPSGWERTRALRREQNFHAGLLRQAQSLTGALGRPLEKITIAPVGAKNLRAKTAPKANHERGNLPKRGGKDKKTSVERTREQIQERKQKEKDSEDSSWWRTTLTSLARLSSRSVQIQKAETLLRNPRTADGWLAVEVKLYRLHLEILDWIHQANREDAEVGDGYRIKILNMIKELMPRASQTAAAIVVSVLTALGFTELAESFPHSKLPSTLDRKLSFDFVKVVKTSGSLVYKFMQIKESPARWMLRCFGEYMDRSLDAQPDQRVPFEPDGWQRKVLDSLDRDESVLVVAPTSAGKTFISYYAMERVLRTSDDGVIVYVAPTKALVTQGSIAAEVSARYSKDVKGRNCWAVYTRDYRIHDPLKSQILITVPEVLSIMLLSPQLARVWTPKLKRIILDEIHTIGQEEGGSVWEQILLLAPCPVVGLSATIGEPEKFNRWLGSVQSAHSFKHTFIEHPHRYSHLRKFFYLPPSECRESTASNESSSSLKFKKFMGISKFERTARLRFLHPVSLLASGMARTLPPDFALEPRDCLKLFDSFNDLRKQGQSCLSVAELEALDPANFFNGARLIKQEDVLQYEAKLKKILDRLIQEPHSHEPTSALQTVVRTLSDDVLADEPEELLAVNQNGTVMENDFINVISDLHAVGDLPALVFSFDRNHCERLARCLLSTLEKAEEEWRVTSPEWRTKMRRWEQWQEGAKERERQKERSQRQRPDENEVEPSSMADEMSSFDPSDPLPDFSFAGGSQTYEKADLHEDLRGLEWTSTPSWALKAITRGIAVHHSGMNRKYRNLVEALFRIGFLRIVIATGTLALGINAPCRTVIFFGDSAFLTALQYRQAAGRAGRRGFDLLGKVVFYGLPFERVQRLVLSIIPPITGQFPLSTTLCLRLFNLLAGSQDSDYAKESIAAVLSLRQMSVGSNIERHGTLHHLRFSIEYLLRTRLLNKDGQPLNLAGMAMHLYYHEPFNIAFVALLQSGIIHQICDESPKIAMEQLMLILSHLFGRRPTPISALNEDTLRPLIKKSPSKIILAPLPLEARNVLIYQNELALQVFSSYACTYAKQYASQLGEDDMFPLSEVRIVPKASHGASNLCGILHSTSMTVSARSAFVAASGNADNFGDVEELCDTVRQGIHLNRRAIPSLDAILSDSQFRLNAYLFDFYMHGQADTLVHANGIRRGDVWFLLQDFDLTLATIKESLQELLLKAAKAAPIVDSDSEQNFMGTGYVDDGDDDDEGSGHDGFSRPFGITDADWKVYEVVSGLSKEFHEKFREMWA